jgi:hypothetical protein
LQSTRAGRGGVARRLESDGEDADAVDEGTTAGSAADAAAELTAVEGGLGEGSTVATAGELAGGATEDVAASGRAPRERIARCPTKPSAMRLPTAATPTHGHHARCFGASTTNDRVRAEMAWLAGRSCAVDTAVSSCIVAVA